MDYLSLYELEQKQAIAAWKSERPSFLQAVAARWNPLNYRMVERSMIERAVEDLDVLAARSRGLAEVARLASISDVDQLRYSPLNECDRLAARICRRSGHDLSVGRRSGDDVVSYHLPPLLVTTLRLVCRIGHCYGFRLDTPRDRAVLLEILDFANQSEPERRAVGQEVRTFPRIRPLPEGDRGGLKPAGSGVSLAWASAEAMPASVNRSGGFALDYGFLNRAAESARRVFQELWLVENGKTDAIPPATQHRRSSLDDLGRAMGHAAYVLGGALGFGAVLPVVVISRMFTHGDRPAARGARDGAQAAVRHADQLIAGIVGDDSSPDGARQSLTLRVLVG